MWGAAAGPVVPAARGRKNLEKRGIRKRLGSKETMTADALPTMLARGTDPKKRESKLLSLESPIMKYFPLGTT
jgi:hypothetical protein